ncbi:MAG TPA: hypothetical protein DCP90_07805 [Clostridiales bacterium]|nr:MAG: hypothetical protein A2Y22_06000 [Clostridiales bacterium GWD2_32_59]HAN10503.1 hypothetical protein [Clostridiales bacterium]
MKLAETQHTELKREITSDIASEIIAFANTDGGKIYIGVEDDGTVVGVSDSDEVSQRVSNMLTDSIEADIKGYVSVENEVIDGKDIVVVHIARGADRPYFIKSVGLMPKGVYVRVGTTKKQASIELIKKMVFESSKISFEKTVSPEQDLTFDDFTKRAKKLGIQLDATKIKNLGLVNEDGKYNYAALLLSDQNPVDVRCARFEGLDKIKFLDKQEIEGSVVSQIDEAMRFVKINNRTDVVITGKKAQRDEYPSYPEVAVREAIINAIIHRDYFDNGNVMIAFFDDRVEIVSPGKLYGGMTVEKMFDGETALRNPILARALHKIEYIEHWGTGMKKIQEAYLGFSKKPKFEEMSVSVKMSLYDMNYERAHNKRSDISTEKFMNAFLGFTEQEQAIYDYLCKNGNITRKEVEELLKVKKNRSSLILRGLEDRGVILKTGGSKNIRYCLKQ